MSRSRKILQDKIVSFFGLNEEYRKDLFILLLDIPEITNGAFSFNEAYDLPIHLRILLLNKKRYEAEKEIQKQEQLALQQTVSTLEKVQSEPTTNILYQSNINTKKTT